MRKKVKGLSIHTKLIVLMPTSKNYAVIGIRWQNRVPLLTVIRKFKDAFEYKTAGVLVIELRLIQSSRKTDCSASPSSSTITPERLDRMGDGIDGSKNPALFKPAWFVN